MIEGVGPVHYKSIHRAIRPLKIGLYLMDGRVVGDPRGRRVEVGLKRGNEIGESEIRGVRHRVEGFDGYDKRSDVFLDA